MEDFATRIKTDQKSSAEPPEEVITTHINADFDALASMIAAKKLYPKAVLVFPGAQEKNIRIFFVHSASYLFDFKRIKQIELDKIKRLVLVDTRHKSRIGKFAEIVDKKNVEIHIYDHHQDSKEDIRGDLEVIRKTGSNTAIMTKLIKDKGLKVSSDEATIMCLGIHEDTGSFTFSSTTAEDYLAAAWLTEQGANHNVVADMLTRELTAEQLWLLNDLTRSATTRVINGVEIVITKVITDEYIGDFAVLVHKFMEMDNLSAVFAMAQMEDRIYIVAGSRTKDVNVAEIATALGGGGHPQAASATVKHKTIIQVERSLLALLKNRINPTKLARDIMSAPVIHLFFNDTVKKAARLMTRYNINVLMVLDKKQRLKGYVTRQVIEKAIFFNLEDIMVNEYMNIDFSTVPPNAPLKKIQNLIISNKLRALPVIENEKVLGVITRTDILNILIGDSIAPEPLHDSRASSQFMRKKNMAAILKERLPKRVINLLKDIGQVADRLGYAAYLVGGPVRDVLLKHANMDVDIVIEGDGIKFAHEFAAHHDVRVRSHLKFRTAVLIFPDNFKVDVATTRMEYYESPGALPKIKTSSIKLDLLRRDFTINALAIMLNKKGYGTLIDYFGGQRDIKGKVLRVLHNLSFVEDPTRVLRAIRFEQRFGFKIGKLTLALIKNAVKINTFKNIEGLRLYHEMTLILKEQDPDMIIERMSELNLLQFVSPDIKLTNTVKTVLAEIKKTIAWYNLLYLEDPLHSWKVYWHGLTCLLDMPALKTLTKKMGLGYKKTHKLILQRNNLNQLVSQLNKPGINNYQVYTLLSSYDTDILIYLMAKTNSDKIKRLISIYFTKLKRLKVHLKGKDLLALGLKPGPHFGKIFDRLLEAKLNDMVETKEEEITFVKEKCLGSHP